MGLVSAIWGLYFWDLVLFSGWIPLFMLVLFLKEAALNSVYARQDHYEVAEVVCADDLA